MKRSVRLAILECDTPLSQTKEKYGGYGGVFTSLLKTGARALDQPELVFSKDGLNITTWNVVEQDYPSLEDIDAVLITGSRFNSFDNDEWILKLVSFTEQLLKQKRIRVIGVCFGHQIVGRALGAHVDRNDQGWETSVSLVRLTEKGQELFEKDLLSIHQMHRDVVYNYPEEVEHLGYSPRCEVQGMYKKGRLITMQGHPEFTEEIMREILETRRDQNIFDDAVFKEAIDRVGNHNDGVVVGKAFLKFLLDED